MQFSGFIWHSSMDFKIAFIIILVTAFTEETERHDLNYTSLMRQYFLLCGPEYFCLEPNETHKWDVETSDSFKNISICPECSCDHACVRRGDCCPDLFFSFPSLQCVNRTIIKATHDFDRESQFSALMVISCPENSDPDVTLKCTNLTDIRNRMLNFPVTHVGFPITYYNVHCAKCNGVQEFKPWTLDIHCRLFADFNYLSSVEDVISMAFDRKCIFQAFELNDNATEDKQQNCFDIDENKTLYTKCNETGEWPIQDEDVQYACESSYKRNFRLFKNIFCYMCNPSGRLYLKPVVAKCNKTGQWENLDNKMERGCKEFPFSPHTLPYKNIFCYMCNKVNDSSRQFVDVIGYIKEFVVDDNHLRFKYNASILKFDLSYLEYTARRIISRYSYLDKTSLVPFSKTTFRNKHGRTINLTSLLAYEAAIEGRVSFCHGRQFDLPRDYRPCSCDLTCALDGTCCSDLALELPATCLSDYELSGSIDVPNSRKLNLVFDGCLEETKYLLFEKECTDPSGKSIFTLLPVSDDRGISYKNFYCVLCNLDSQHYIKKLSNNYNFSFEHVESKVERSNVLQTYFNKYEKVSHTYKIWHLEMNCPCYLDYSHILTSGSLISLAQKLNCRVRYREKDGYSNLCLKFPHVSKCSESPNWTYVDDDIKWACNEAVVYNKYYASKMVPKTIKSNNSLDFTPEKIYRSDMYSNVFCALCRPLTNFTTHFIDDCPENQSNKDCVNLPRIYFYYPFKNRACTICNGIGLFGYAGRDVYPEDKTSRYITGLIWYPVLRNLFSFTQNDGTLRLDRHRTRNCTENQVFDEMKNRCRNIICYEGKYLKGSECIPLLPTTKNLMYSMGFKAEISHVLNNSKLDFFDTALSIVSQKVIESLQIKSGYLSITIYIENNDEYYFCESETCVLSVYMISEIFIRSSINRYKVEISLLQLFHSVLNGSGSISSILISPLPPDITYENVSPIQDSFWEADGDNKAKHSGFSSTSYFASYVSELLLCRQIELHKDEYVLWENKSSIFLTRLKIEIEPSKYTFSPMNEIRVCLDYLEHLGYFPSYEVSDEQNSALIKDVTYKTIWIVSLLCTIVSVLSLFFSLVLYCFLPNLRTTSGKLLMLMMMSLLFTLVFFQLSLFVTQSRTGCIAIGFILHFSWLSVFFSMNVCNYRTFYCFSSRSLTTPTTKTKAWSKELLQCAAYAFGMPLICVCLNVMIASFSKGNFILGYGGNRCFIDTLISNILTFITPVIIVCLTNVFFFIFTVRAIRRAPTVRSNQKERSELAIYLRLTSITGASWLLQIVDSFLPFTAFSYVATSVTLLQGLFIFLAFAAKSRNFKLLRLLHRSSKHKQEN